MRFEYIFSNANIITGLCVDGPYLTFWTNTMEKWYSFIDFEVLGPRGVFPKGYKFIHIYRDVAEHDDSYRKLHSDVYLFNPLNWLSNNVGPHFHFKCTKNGKDCEVTPHLLKQVLTNIASYQKDIKDRKRFQEIAQVTKPKAANLHTEKLYFPETEIDTIYDKSKSIALSQLAGTQDLSKFSDRVLDNHVPLSAEPSVALPNGNNNATIELTILSTMSALFIYWLCFRSKKPRSERHRSSLISDSHPFHSRQKVRTVGDDNNLCDGINKASTVPDFMDRYASNPCSRRSV